MNENFVKKTNKCKNQQQLFQNETTQHDTKSEENSQAKVPQKSDAYKTAK